MITQFEMMTSTELSGSGMFSISPFKKLHVFHSGFALILPRQGQHFVSHVEAVRFACRSNALGGKQHVDAAAGAQIEDGFAGAEFGERGWVAATERRKHRLFGNLAGLTGVIEVRGDRIDGSRVNLGLIRNRSCRRS